MELGNFTSLMVSYLATGARLTMQTESKKEITMIEEKKFEGQMIGHVN